MHSGQKKKALTALCAALALSLLVPAEAYADHTHTAACYAGTQHICSGSAETGGGCYTEAVNTYHKHTGKAGQTYANGCYTVPVYTYHKHTGKAGQTYANGCYTVPVYTYHKHTAACYTEKDTDCSHTLTFGTEAVPGIPSLLVCPQCGRETFTGFRQDIVCGGTQYTAYAGLCASCGYAGNCTGYTGQITDGKPMTAVFTHTVKTETLTCGKTENTAESVVYTLGCGKTENSIESVVYTPGCGKSETVPEKTVYKKTCGKESGHYYDASGKEVQPVCSQIAVSVAPKVPVQTAQTPDFTLTVTYLDGHTAEVQPQRADWSAQGVYKDQDISLYWTGQSNAYGQKTQFVTSFKLTTPEKAKAAVTSLPAPVQKTVTPLPQKNTVQTAQTAQTAQKSSTGKKAEPRVTAAPEKRLTVTPQENTESTENAESTESAEAARQDTAEEKQDAGLPAEQVTGNADTESSAAVTVTGENGKGTGTGRALFTAICAAAAALAAVIGATVFEVLRGGGDDGGNGGGDGGYPEDGDDTGDAENTGDGEYADSGRNSGQNREYRENGYGGNAGNGYQGNGYQGTGYGGNTGNGYQGNGYRENAGNGYPGNGYGGYGYPDAGAGTDMPDDGSMYAQQEYGAEQMQGNPGDGGDAQYGDAPWDGGTGV